MSSTSSINENPSEITINRINYCKAITKKGNGCRKKASSEKLYCKQHEHLFKYEKPEECPICIESSQSINQPLSCGHWICRNCVLKWGDKCPICRSPITITKKERKIMDKYKLEQKDDREDLTIQAITSLLRQEMASNSEEELEHFTLEPHIFNNIQNHPESNFNLNEEESDYLSAFVMAHALANIVRHLRE